MRNKMGIFINRARQHPAAAAVAALLATYVVFAAFPGIIARQDPLAQNISVRLEPPSSAHVFGTDGFGRDVFSRVMYGARITLYVALLSVLIS